MTRRALVTRDAMDRPAPAIRLLPTLLAAVLLAACATTTPGGTATTTPGGTVAAGTAAPVELTIYAAASLKGAMEQIAPAYARAAPGVTLTLSSGASSALRTQIEQGAPADVFLSADTKQPGVLVDAGLASGAVRVFAANQLTVIVPTDDRAGIAMPADLARAGVKIIAAGDAVPITAYASEVVANLGSLAGYPAGFAQAYAANVVSREDDVKAVVAKIELGEGDAAIVYRTDALASDAVSTMEIPAAANVSAEYGGVVVKASTHLEQATAFLEWLVGPDGQVALASFGFAPSEP